MILTVHIDNRVITLVGYEDEVQVVSTSVGADLSATADQYAAGIRTVLTFCGADTDAVDGAVISSVVPVLTHILQNAVRRLTKGKVLLVGAGMKTGLNLRLDSAGTVGSDFICNAVAALHEFQPPLVLLHMAGATTFAAVDAQGILCGRSILPGVEASLMHLCESAALLPDVSFDPRAKLMGRGTADAIRSGALYGAVSMVEGMLDRYTKAAGENTAVVATGSIAEIILPLCRQKVSYRPQLLHDGLRLLFRKNN